jgi:hypothetical protein
MVELKDFDQLRAAHLKNAMVNDLMTPLTAA